MAKAVSSSASLKQDVPLFIAYVSLVVLALLPIYFGSYQSLRTPKSVLDARKAAKKGKSGKKTTETDDEDNEDEEQEAQTETLTSADAYLFPVIGSVVLFSLYLVFKYLDRTWVDRILSVYFALVGSAAVYKVALSLTEGIVGTASWKKFLQYKIHVTHTLTDKELEAERKARAGEATKEGKDGEETADEKPQRTRNVLKIRLSKWHLPLFIASLIPVGVFYVTRHWIASNTIALCLALNAVSLMGLDSFLTGSIMLGGLFLYDIFWVFGTEVMVSVARNFDAGPIKIIFPKNLPQVVSHISKQRSSAPWTAQNVLAWLQGAPKWQMTMLGLGDIVIPGIFIALALRFDQHLYVSSLSPTALAKFQRTDTSYPKPYFTATLTAYVAGLATTMGVMHVFQAAQPALLYLSPACVAAIALEATKRGEWSRVWSWKDEDEDESEGAKKEVSKETKKKKSNKKQQ